MFAKVKKGAISKAIGDAKKTVVSKVKEVSKEVSKEFKDFKANRNNGNTTKEGASTSAAATVPATEKKAQQTSPPQPSVPVETKEPLPVQNDKVPVKGNSPSQTTKEASKGAETANGVLDVEWNKLMLQKVNEKRQERDGCVPIVWSDACYEQALIVAKGNAQTGLNGYGVKDEIKAAIKKVHTKCKGTFKVTTQTMDLTNLGSTNEAFYNLEHSEGHWGMLMNPDAVIGGFAAVQNGDTVYWMGICIKVFPGR